MPVTRFKVRDVSAVAKARRKKQKDQRSFWDNSDTARFQGKKAALVAAIERVMKGASYARKSDGKDQEILGRARVRRGRV